MAFSTDPTENLGLTVPGISGIVNYTNSTGIFNALSVITISQGGTGATTFNTNGVIYYNGTTLASTSAGTAGQLLVSEGAGAAPSYQSIVGSGNITVVSTGGTITITSTGSVASSFVEDSGTAIPAGGVLNVLGGTGITTFGTNSTVTITLSGSGSFSTNGVIYFNGSSLVTATGTAGQILTINNSGTPQFATFTFTENSGSAIFSTSDNLNILGAGGISTLGAGSTVTITLSGSASFTTDGIIYWNGTSFVSTSAGTAGQLLVSEGPGAAPSYQTINGTAPISVISTGGTITVSITSPLPIANGGTNATSFANNNGVVYYTGTALASISPGTNGQLLVSEGAGAPPAYQSIVGSGQVTVTSTGGTITIASTGSVASSFVENIGTATPSGGTLNILGGTGVTTVGTNATVTINLSGSGSFSTNGVIYFNGSSLVTATGTSGQILTINNSGIPQFATFTFTENSGSAIFSTSDNLNILGIGGISTSGAGSTVTITLSGSASFTTDGVIYWNGTSLVSTSAGTAGQLLVSKGPGAGPTYQTITGAGQITVTSTGGTITIASSSAVASSFVEDFGTATPAGGVLNVFGGTGITTFGTNSTITITLAGSGSFITNGVIYFDGATLVTTAAGTDSPFVQILGPNNSGVPTFLNLQEGSGISITSDGTSQITISASTDVATTYAADNNTSATPLNNLLNVFGGTGITTTGTGNTLMFSLLNSDAFVTDGIIYWNGTALATTSTGIAGQLLVSEGSGAGPTYQTITGTGQVTVTSTGGTITIATTGSVASSFVENTGTAIPSGGTLHILGGTGLNTVGTNATVTINITGAGSFITNGNVYWNGTAFATTSAGVAGQLLVSEGPGAPQTFQTITGTAPISVVSTGGIIAIASNGTLATTYTENTGSATPSGGTLNIVGGTGASTEGTNNTVTIDVIGGGFKWNNVTITAGTGLLPSNGYVAAAVSGQVLFTIPASPVFGDVYRIVGNASSGNTGWRITLGASQKIQAGTLTVLPGSTYSSTKPSDCIELLCIIGGVTSTFAVMDMQGSPSTP